MATNTGQGDSNRPQLPPLKHAEERKRGEDVEKECDICDAREEVLGGLLSDARVVAGLLHDREGDIDDSVYQLVILFISYLGRPENPRGPEFDLEMFTPTIQSLCRIVTVLRCTRATLREVFYEAVISHIVEGLERREGNSVEEEEVTAEMKNIMDAENNIEQDATGMPRDASGSQGTPIYRW